MAQSAPSCESTCNRLTIYYQKHTFSAHKWFISKCLLLQDGCPCHFHFASYAYAFLLSSLPLLPVSLNITLCLLFSPLSRFFHHCCFPPTGIILQFNPTVYSVVEGVSFATNLTIVANEPIQGSTVVRVTHIPGSAQRKVFEIAVQCSRL